MANPDSVAQFYLDNFGAARVATITPTQFNTTGNAVITIPLLSGGLTNSATGGASGAIIIRRISVVNPSGSLATANLSITQSNDGNVSNLVCANLTLSSITGVNTFQDLTLSGGNVVVHGDNCQALFVNVNVASANASTAQINVYGDVVRF
jgi:hypothetical protein